MITFRRATKEDLAMIDGWYLEMGMSKTNPALIPPTTYVAKFNGQPVASAALVLTNCTGVALIENVVGHPAMPALRREALPELFRYLKEMAKDWGAKYLFLSSFEDKVKTRYEEYGFKKKTDNLTLFFIETE